MYFSGVLHTKILISMLRVIKAVCKLSNVYLPNGILKSYGYFFKHFSFRFRRIRSTLGRLSCLYCGWNLPKSEEPEISISFFLAFVCSIFQLFCVFLFLPLFRRGFFTFSVASFFFLIIDVAVRSDLWFCDLTLSLRVISTDIIILLIDLFCLHFASIHYYWYRKSVTPSVLFLFFSTLLFLRVLFTTDICFLLITSKLNYFFIFFILGL